MGNYWNEVRNEGKEYEENMRLIVRRKKSSEPSKLKRKLDNEHHIKIK